MTIKALIDLLDRSDPFQEVLIRCKVKDDYGNDDFVYTEVDYSNVKKGINPFYGGKAVIVDVSGSLLPTEE